MGVWGCFGVKKKEYYGYVYCKQRLKELKCYDFIQKIKNKKFMYEILYIFYFICVFFF